jgi:hypothetical protein
MNIPPNSILGAIRLCQVSNVMFLRGISSVYVEGNLDSLAGLTRSGPGLQGFRDTSHGAGRGPRAWARARGLAAAAPATTRCL